MKRFCLCIVLALINFNVFSQVKMKVLIDDAPFMLYEKVYNKKSVYQDDEALFKDWKMYHVKKGTEVIVIDRSYYHTMLKVQLSDGSIGYMPTVSFVPASEMSFTIDYPIDAMPAGKYDLVGLGPMKQLNSDTNSVAPEYYLYKGENGRRYKVNVSRSKVYYTDPYDPIIWITSTYMDFLYKDFFAAHPEIDRYDRDPVMTFKLKKGKLPVKLMGYSKSYIESLIGEPVSYAGPGLSQYEGYTFAYYRNIAWDTEISRKHDDAGIIIYFNSDMQAVHMQKAPLNWFYNDFYTSLYLPLKAESQPDPDIAAKISASERKGKYVYRPTEPAEEVYTAPGIIVKMLVGSMYLVEMKFGVTNRWAILGIILALMCLLTFVVNKLIKLLPFSNNTVKTVAFFLNAPIVIYAMLYLSRFYIIAAFLAVCLLIVIASEILQSVSNDVDRNRCGKCRTWLEDVTVLKTVEDPKVSVSQPKIVLFTGLTVGRNFSTRHEGGVTIRESSRGRNFKTTVNLSWDAEETLKCPNCGHVWTYKFRKSETVPGPIHFSNSTKSEISRSAEEVTTTRIVNRNNNEVLHEEETGRRRITQTTSGPSSYHYTSHSQVYDQYLQRYLNGERDALNEYERKYWGNVLC